MKNRIIAFLVSFILLCSLVTTTVFGEDETVVYYYDSVETVPAEDSTDNQTPEPSISAELLVEPVQDDWSDKMGEILSSACDWVRNSEQGRLYLFCMGAAGKSAISTNVNQYISEVALRKEYSEAILLPYDILNVTFSGYSATNILGKDLISQITSDYTQIDQTDLYTVAYTLLALNSNNYTVPSTYKNSPKNLATMLLKFQNQDGGFSSHIGSQSSVIQTGLAITALSPYYKSPEYTPYIDAALNFISTQQQPDGGFLDNGAPSSIANSKVVVALNSLDISLHDNRYVKEENTALTALMQCLSTDGGFSLDINSKSDIVATENAILALSSVKKKHSPYELDTVLYASSQKMPANIVISTSQRVSLSIPIFYISLGALTLALIVLMIVSKFHPFSYIEKLEEKRQETQ